MYSLVETPELINDLSKNGRYHLEVSISSNYRMYIDTIDFMSLNNLHYFKMDNRFYQCPSNITINDILKQKYADYDHYHAEHSDLPLSTILHNEPFNVEIHEKGSILYRD